MSAARARRGSGRGVLIVTDWFSEPDDDDTARSIAPDAGRTFAVLSPTE
jgi:hypothetical protein